jgi:hypothetical protein
MKEFECKIIKFSYRPVRGVHFVTVHGYVLFRKQKISQGDKFTRRCLNRILLWEVAKGDRTCWEIMSSSKYIWYGIQKHGF